LAKAGFEQREVTTNKLFVQSVLQIKPTFVVAGILTKTRRRLAILTAFDVKVRGPRSSGKTGRRQENCVLDADG
jgi:hypothetical protein